MRWCTVFVWCYCFFFKQKTAYDMRISDWSSDVCSSDLDLDDAGLLGDAPSGDAAVPLLHEALVSNPVVIDVPAGVTVTDPIIVRHVGPADGAASAVHLRSDARRVGKQSVSTCRSRWAPYH